MLPTLLPDIFDNMLQIIEAHPNWPCMLLSLSIHLHGLHLDAQYIRHDSCRLLWSATLLLLTLLSDSQVSISLIIHSL